MTQAPPPDSLRAVLDTVFAGPAYDWVEPENPFAWLRGAWFAVVEFFERLRVADPLLFRLAVGGLVAVLLGILLHAAWVMFRAMRAAEADDAPRARRQAERRDAAWFDREADRLAGDGRYVDALHAAFVALALRLQERGLARYEPSRTPREYARAARLAPGDRRRLDELVASLYRHAFAGEPVTAADYRAWRARAGEEWDAAAA